MTAEVLSLLGVLAFASHPIIFTILVFLAVGTVWGLICAVLEPSTSLEDRKWAIIALVVLATIATIIGELT